MKKSLLLIFILSIGLKGHAQSLIGHNAQSIGEGGVNGTEQVGKLFCVNKADAFISYQMLNPSSIRSHNLAGDIFIKIGKNMGLHTAVELNLFEKQEYFSPQGDSKGYFSPKDIVASIGFCYAFSEQWAFDISANLINSTLTPAIKPNAFSGSITFMYHGILDASISLNHIGTNLKYGDSVLKLPTIVKFGIWKNFTVSSHHDLKPCLNIGYVIFHKSLSCGIGFEYAYKWFNVGSGYHFGTNVDSSFASIGIGCHLKSGFKINMAYLIATDKSHRYKNSFAITTGYAF